MGKLVLVGKTSCRDGLKSPKEVFIGFMAPNNGTQ